MSRPKDASTLIIVDRSGTDAESAARQAPSRHKFMPGKFVFPGGRLEPNDRLMPIARRSQSGDRKIPDGRDAAAERCARARAGARRHPRDLRGDRPDPRRETRRRAARAGRARGRNSPAPASIPTCRSCISSRARSRPRAGRAASTPASSPSMPRRSPIASKMWCIPKPNWSNWSGCRSREARKLDMPTVTGRDAAGAGGAGGRRFQPRPAGAVLPDAAEDLLTKADFLKSHAFP